MSKLEEHGDAYKAAYDSAMKTYSTMTKEELLTWQPVVQQWARSPERSGTHKAVAACMVIYDLLNKR